jgi:hypothetical protein
MNLAIAVGISLLFFGLCIAGIIFVVKRYGGKPAVGYIASAIVIRILIRAFDDHVGEGEADGVALVVPFVILRLWPYVIAQKMRERVLMQHREQEEAETPPDSSTPS